MTRVVVTGARGFLGGALVRSLRADGRAVVGVSRAAGPHVDVTLESLDALAGHLCAGDVVINAAGVPVKDAASDVALIRDNLHIARAVAAACACSEASLLHVSSADIWPLDARAGALEDANVLPDSAYGMSKLAAEQALALAISGALRLLVVRPTYVYGPGMFEGRVFPAVVRQALSGHTVVLRGDPEAGTDYLYVDDFIRAVALLLEQDQWDGRAFHVGSGALTTLAELARTLARAVNAHAEVRFDEVPTGPRQVGPVSTARIRALGFTPAFDIGVGCAQYATSARKDAA